MTHVLSTMTVLERRHLIDVLGEKAHLSYDDAHFLIAEVIDPLLERTSKDAVRLAFQPLIEILERVEGVEHNGHAAGEGEPDCGGCWFADIRRVIERTRP